MQSPSLKRSMISSNMSPCADSLITRLISSVCGIHPLRRNISDPGFAPCISYDPPRAHAIAFSSSDTQSSPAAAECEQRSRALLATGTMSLIVTDRHSPSRNSLQV